TRSAPPPRPASENGRTGDGDEALRGTHGRDSGRRRPGRPRASGERGLDAAVVAGAARHHLRGRARDGGADRAARPPHGVKFFAATLVLFTALTAVMTWPQALHMHDGVHDDGDPLLNAWALAWVAHQLPRAPAHLFDANIFYPERRALAFSETLIAPAV